MRVAIVYPEVYDLARFREKRKEFPPFGPLYLAAVVEQTGIEVRMFKVSPGATRLDLRAYDAVAFSISSSATYGLIRDARYTSQYSGDPLIMGGGVHANFYPEETLIDLTPHVVGVGEGEETILELLREARSRRFEKISGVCYRDGSVIRKTLPRMLMKNLDDLPLPARHLLDRSDFLMADRLAGTNLELAHVMFSRGCPFPCTFCAAAQTRMQVRSGQSARRELIHLKETYGVQGFAIADDNFIVNKRKVAAICIDIADLDLKWSALSRVDTVDLPLLQTMARAGCIEIKYGMESGSESLLRSMKKNITRDDIRRAVVATVQAGIRVRLFVIHGYPGENRETTEETISLLTELAPMVGHVSLFRFVPLPGTYVYNHPEEHNLRGTNRQADWDGDWSKYHIHHNHHHWWGSSEDFRVVQESYERLSDFISETWDAHPLALAAE